MRHLLLVLTWITLAAQVAQGAPCPRVDAHLKQFDHWITSKKVAFEGLPGTAFDLSWTTSKLAHMVELDQYLRHAAMNWPADHQYSSDELACFWRGLQPRWERIDGDNTDDLEGLMHHWGWFDISQFGLQGASDAWLLAQHADHDRSFQRRVLALLETRYPVGEALPRHYAFLFDRVKWFGDSLPQRYGSQGHCVAPGDWQPFPVEDPEHLDDRRLAMGMNTSADNKAKLDKVCR